MDRALLQNRGPLDLAPYLDLQSAEDVVQTQFGLSDPYIPVSHEFGLQSFQTSSDLVHTVPSSSPLTTTASSSSSTVTLPASSGAPIMTAKVTQSLATVGQDSSASVVSSLPLPKLRVMQPASFGSDPTPVPAVFPAPTSAPQQWQGGVSVSSTGVPLGGQLPPGLTLSKVAQVPPSTSPALPPVPASGSTQAPSQLPPSFLPVWPAQGVGQTVPTVVPPPSTLASVPLTGVQDPVSDRDRLISAARANGEDDPDSTNEPRTNMRQIRLFVAEMLPELIPLPDPPEDPIGATGASLLDRSLLDHHRDKEMERELKRSTRWRTVWSARRQSSTASGIYHGC